MTGAELSELLSRIQVAPNRQLGQNFLVDAELSRWIVDQLDLQPDDVVVEVGPGTGALSRCLAGRCRRLILIEKDRRLVEYLRGVFASFEGGVEVLHGDAVEFDKRQLFAGGAVKLIGNLPYSAATPIMGNFLAQPTPVSRAVLMLQKEVAERVAAKPRSKAYGKLGLRIQCEWDVELLRSAGPELFYPRPKVDSSVLMLETRVPETLPYFSKRKFDELTGRGFAQRRKLLRKNIGQETDHWGEVASRLGFGEQARAEELSLLQWIQLCNELDDHPALELPEDSGGEIFDVVDERNRVQKQALRAEVHRQAWRHRAVHIFVLDKRGQIFLQKRSPAKDSHSGLWDTSAAGHLDAGEDYRQAAERELYEELMVKVEMRKEGGEGGLRELARIDACEETGWEFVRLYSCGVVGKIRTHGREVSCGAYFPVSLVEEWVRNRPEDFVPGFVECFRRFTEEVEPQPRRS